MSIVLVWVSDYMYSIGMGFRLHSTLGRCSWGDECRFVHETPSNTEDSSPRKRHSRSPIEYSLRSFRPPHSYRGLPPSLDHTHTRLPHPHSLMDFGTFSHGEFVNCDVT